MIFWSLISCHKVFCQIDMKEDGYHPFVDTCKLLCSRKVTYEHTGVFVWGGLWLILIEITFKQWVVEVPELGIKFKNVVCFHVRVGWLPTSKVQQKLLRWRVGEQWEWFPPRIREFIFCRELKNRNKTVFALYDYHVPTVLNSVSENTPSLMPLSHTITIFRGWYLTDNLTESNPV